jgi:hypothetical protein
LLYTSFWPGSFYLSFQPQDYRLEPQCLACFLRWGHANFCPCQWWTTILPISVFILSSWNNWCEQPCPAM